MERVIALRGKAKKNKKKIVLPEADDPRVVEAARIIKEEGFADIILLTDEVKARYIDELAVKAVEIKRIDVTSPEEARSELMDNPALFAAVMTMAGLADGFVAGAKLTSAAVIRDALRGMEIDKKVGTVSSVFIIILPNQAFGDKGLFIYADCGVNPVPSAAQLSRIAISSSGLLSDLFGGWPRIAMLSYSTKGSAEGDSVERVRAAVDLVKTKRADLMVDGELQFDSAVMPDVAKIKCPDSQVAGKANVLIFPSLDAGNIAYKATERLARARAVGPILLGFTKPVSDLSRGCSVDDIIDAVAVTAVRA